MKGPGDSETWGCWAVCSPNDPRYVEPDEDDDEDLPEDVAYVLTG